MTHLVPVLRPVLGSPFRRGDLYRIAGAMPALHLSPRETGTWNDLISGQDLTTFSRANTSPTYELDGVGGLVGFSSGQRAIGYSPETGVRGGSIFGQRTQLLASPQSVGGSGWMNQNSIGVTLNTTDVTDPLGGNTATKLVYGAANSQTIQTQTLGVSQYQSSVFLRTTSGTATIRLYVFLQSAPFTIIGTTDVTVGTAWQRFNVQTSTATAAAYNIGINMPNSGTTVYAWGANVTAGSVLYPYIGGQITCPADVLSIDGTNFSQWYQQAGGTLLVSASRQVVGAVDAWLATVSDGTGANRIQLGDGDTLGNYGIVVSNASMGGATPPISGRKKTAAASFKVGTCGVSINGGDTQSFTVSSLPVVNKMSIGAFVFGAGTNCHIHDILYWPPGSPAENRLQQLSAALP